MLRANEVRAMSPADRKARLDELRHELMQERGVQAMGGSTPSPGKIRTLRREIARILTIERQVQLGIGPKKESAK
jgi:large subunit ribosomal protein L29